MPLAAEAVAAGDVTASTPYLEVLDRFDRCQTLASANRVYDDEARKKLMDKIKRLANKLDIDENFAAAAQAHLKKTGQIPDDELGEADGDAGDRGQPDYFSCAFSRLLIWLVGCRPAPPRLGQVPHWAATLKARAAESDVSRVARPSHESNAPGV